MYQIFDSKTNNDHNSNNGLYKPIKARSISLYFYSIIITLLQLSSLSSKNHQVECSSAMKRLYEDLFSDYNRLILPVAKNKTKVRVSVGLKLGQILDLNLKAQILSTNVWVEQEWHDYKLEWEPNLYDGIDMIHVPAENIWIPDIVLFNNADGNYELTLVAKARVYYNGTVIWRPPTMFRSTCEIDVEFFPFDIQTCYLRFGSWTYAGDEVELSLRGGNKTSNKITNGIDLSQFYKNVEWDIIDVPAYYNEVHYDCCSEPYSDITFKIVIRRKILFYLVNLILPVALMTFLTVSVFYLPSDSNEKVTLSISILTSLIVFFLLMLEIIPPSSLAVPLFGKYLLFTLVLVSLSACVSVYVLNMHHRSPTIHSMSPRMRQLFLKTLPRLLFLNQPDPRERSSLNRFRQKKIAQQLLKQAASPTNKVYDLAQPMAASLNLIETLHKSYQFDAASDLRRAQEAASQDDEGRFFRRYVDEYIEQLKKRQHTNNNNNKVSNNNDTNNNGDYSPAPGYTGICGQYQPSNRYSTSVKSTTGLCCPRAAHSSSQKMNYRNLQQQASGGGCSQWQDMSSFSGPMNERSTDLLCPIGLNSSGNNNNKTLNQRAANDNQLINNLNNNNKQQATYLGLLNDDTLDMTFDCDEQDNGPQPQSQLSLQQQQQQATLTRTPLQAGKGTSLSTGVEELPTPPPPPRELSHLSKSGRVSSCSRGDRSAILQSPSDDSYSARLAENGGPQLADHKLVDNLMSSILMLNDDDFDTTTNSCYDDNNNGYGLSNDQLAYQTSNKTTREILAFGGGQMPGSHIQSNKLINATNCNACHNDTHEQQRFHKKTASIIHDDGLDCPSSCSETNNDDCFIGAGPPMSRDFIPEPSSEPSELLLSLRLPYDKMPAHVRAAIRSILFIADTIKNEDDENSAIEDWESMSMVVDRLFFCIFFLLCTIGSAIILGSAPALYDYRVPVDDRLHLDSPPLSTCDAISNHLNSTNQ